MMDSLSMVNKLYAFTLDSIAGLSKDKATKYLVSNKINCIYMQENLDDLLLSKSSNVREVVKELYDIQLQERKQWSDSFQDVQHIWDKHNIKSLFHKSCGEFPFLSDNLDVLVPEGDYLMAHKLLLDNGYIELRSIQEPHKKFYRKMGGESFFVPIHLHKRVCWGVPYDDNDHLWEFSQVSKQDIGVVFPSYEDAFITTIAHAFIEDHVFKIGDLIKVALCVEKGLDWEYINNNVVTNHWIDAYVVALDCLNYLTKNTINENVIPPSVISKYDDLLAKRYNQQSAKVFKREPIILPYKLPHLRVRYYSSMRFINDPVLGSKAYNALCAALFLVDGVINLKLKYRNQPSYLVTLSGADGSGKTYFRDHLIKALDTYGLKYKVVWMRYGSMPTAHFINSQRKKLRGYPSGEVSSPQQKAKAKAGSLAWLGLNIIDVLLVSIRYRITMLMSRKIYIFDRNLLDFLVDYSVSSGKVIPKGIVKLLASAFPRLNYGVLIVGGASPKVSEQENENPVLQEKYYELYRKYFPNIIRITNNMDYESCDAVATHTVRNIFKMYPEKYSGYRTTSMKYK